LVERLTGLERTTAIEMIAAGVQTGREHFISAAAYLHIASVIPPLTAMLARAPNGYGRYVLGSALHTLGALGDDALFDIMWDVVKNCPWSQAINVLGTSYIVFSPATARKLIDAGLHRADYGIRFSAYDALIAVSYIEQHGGTYTKEIGTAISTAWIASATIGSGVPGRYNDKKYFLGEDVYPDEKLFTARLEELAARYAPPL
jgi:hypothetical protein